MVKHNERLYQAQNLGLYDQDQARSHRLQVHPLQIIYLK